MSDLGLKIALLELDLTQCRTGAKTNGEVLYFHTLRAMIVW
jgi:hypothetical protein